MAAAQAGGARPRREAEPRREEALSGLGAAAGGSGNAGSGACPGERCARSAAGSAAGLRRRPGSPGCAFSPRGAGGWGLGARGPASPFLHRSGFLSRRRRPLPGLRVVRSAAPFLPAPSAAAPGGELGRPAWSGSPGRDGLAPRLPEVGDRGRGVGQALRGRFTFVRSTVFPPQGKGPGGCALTLQGPVRCPLLQAVG